MKKYLFMIIAFLFLVGCGSNAENELNEFIESYNENAYEFVGVDLIYEDEIGKVEKEKYGSWQSLYELEEYYSIYAKYQDDENLTGFYISIAKEQPYENQEGIGYEASLVIAETLDLDRNEFVKEYEKSLESDTGDTAYSDNGYNISFYNFSIPGAEEYNGMTINFDNQEYQDTSN